ncbi:MAG: phosphoribosyltransferase family protein [Chloroflexota bacterium]|nr:phosphoribosyltransferase family protein [Chloroflexota bacterium]
MIDLYKDTKWSVDMIVPVPVGKTRAEERGYNQAALLAIPLSLKLGIIYSSKAIHKTRDVKSQVGLSLEQRFMNVAGAFTASTNVVQNKSILLVDDVITSGATLNTCTKALIDAGALRVYGITLARAGIHQV